MITLIQIQNQSQTNTPLEYAIIGVCMLFACIIVFNCIRKVIKKEKNNSSSYGGSIPDGNFMPDVMKNVADDAIDFDFDIDID